MLDDFGDVRVPYQYIVQLHVIWILSLFIGVHFWWYIWEGSFFQGKVVLVIERWRWNMENIILIQSMCVDIEQVLST